ncbi:MAG: hypothetical protein JSS63_02510 [Bacteroidetes bacterium]|nr:hypothetical protein [Bacteroidota bacterium]
MKNKKSFLVLIYSLFFSTIISLVFSEAGSKQNTGKSISQHTDTIYKLSDWNYKDTVYLKVKGKYYLMFPPHADDGGEDEQDDPENGGNISAAGFSAASKNEACDGEAYDGSDRKNVKTTYYAYRLETFQTLSDFLETLPKDSDVGSNEEEPISTGEDSRRVVAEKRRIYIKQTWVYAFARQADEDYHVIIGSSDKKSESEFFNVEISGLPGRRSNSYPKMKKVRGDFKEIFGIDECKTGYVKFYNNPIKISLKGIAFFDQLHFKRRNAIGPKEARGKTYWELHPVYEIKTKE